MLSKGTIYRYFYEKEKAQGMNLKLSAIESYFFHRSRLNLHSCFYVGIKLNELPKKVN